MGIVYCGGSCGLLGLLGYWAGCSGASHGQSWAGSAFPLKAQVLCSLSSVRAGCRDFGGCSQAKPACLVPGFGQKHLGALHETCVGLAVRDLPGVLLWGWGGRDAPPLGWRG